MRFVLDASVAACWAFDDEDHPVADAALGRTLAAGIIVPGIWWFEIRNVLLMAERRQRLMPARTSAFLTQLKRLDLVIDKAPDGEDAISLARRHALAVYDAAYLELAMRAGCPLATLDKRLAAAAEAAGVGLIA